MSRPDRDTYYMVLAQAVAARADCRGLSVGAVIVKDNRVLSTGYNGTPEGFDNCTDGGGCLRCDRRKDPDTGTGIFSSGEAYDLCICVHAEANALLAAARHGIAVDDGVLYCTHQPCFACSKELIQAGIRKAFYLNDLSPPSPSLDEARHETDVEQQVHAQLQAQQERLMGRLAAVRLHRPEDVESTLSQMAVAAGKAAGA